MDTIAFARGVPAPEMLPVDLIKQAADLALQRDPVTILSYGTGGGYGPLRERLAHQHQVQPGQVIITTGSLHGFALFTELLAHERSTAPLVIVENPTYDRPLLVLRRNGCRIVAVRIDQHGIDPDALRAAVERERPAFIYVIPSFQNPAGCTLSESRRRAVLEIAIEHDVPIFEDDPYGQLHFTTAAPESLHARAGDATVIYAGSFSKTISPGLRVGYLVLPPDLATRLERYANDTYISATLLGEAIVDIMLDRDEVAPHVVRVRQQLAARCNAMCDALDRHLPEARYVRPEGGYFLWGDLPTETASADLLAAAGAHGVSFVAGSSCGPDNDRAIRLAFSSPPIELIDEGIRRVSALCSASGRPSTNVHTPVS